MSQQQERLEMRAMKAERVAWQGDRAHNWQSEHRTWQQRGGYNGYRIPEDRYGPEPLGRNLGIRR